MGNSDSCGTPVTSTVPAVRRCYHWSKLLLCSGQVGVTYSITSVAGATGYTWAVPLLVLANYHCGRALALMEITRYPLGSPLQERECNPNHRLRGNGTLTAPPLPLVVRQTGRKPLRVLLNVCGGATSNL